MSHVTHLECSLTGKRYEPNKPYGLSEAGRPLIVRYDTGAIKASLSKDDLASRTGGFWKYREFLPVEKQENEVSLGEVMTPIMRAPQLERQLGVTGEILFKDESRQPTGSFKARGIALAVAKAKEFGFDHLAIPTNGNAGAALSAYGRRAGMKITVLCPDDTPQINIDEAAFQGGDVFKVNGFINHCGAIVQEGKEKVGWYDISTLKEPYRIEGKKTAGIELAEQMGWELPDAIFYPVGGGTLIIGMWKAFQELEDMGWIGSKRPKMIAVQAKGCAPIVEAWENGEKHARVWEDAFTAAAGIRVPGAVGDFLILDAVRDSGGFAAAIEEDVIFDTWHKIGREEGIMTCPETAACFAAYEQALQSGQLEKTDRALFFNCATGLKYPMVTNAGDIDRHKDVDFGVFSA